MTAPIPVRRFSRSQPLKFAVPSEHTHFGLGPDAPNTEHAAWKVIISDDDEDVHVVSRMLLRDFSFDGRKLHFLSAFSGAETRRLLRDNPDAAVLILDVVMETDHEGLQVIRHVREDLRNAFVRIILRTGQPGLAPETQVVEDYDINDYREKSELTAQKLATSVRSALRAYRDLRSLDNSRRGLEHIIGATGNLFAPHSSLRRFATGILDHASALISLSQGGIPAGVLDAPTGFAATRYEGGLRVVAATDAYRSLVGHAPDDALPAGLYDLLRDGAANGEPAVIRDRTFASLFVTRGGRENLIYLSAARPLDDVQQRLLRVLATNLAVAYDNIFLARELTDGQAELIQALSDAVETRSSETSQHTGRVGRGAALLAQLIGLPDDQIEMVRLVAPMHDLGKIGIPDAILNKPGPLTPEEYKWVKAHTTIGHNILKSSTRPVLVVAARVCLEHHEHWDGSGYPQGLRGQDIHIVSRITGLVDVFDAVSHHRPYKKAWPPEMVYDLIRNERGRHFDPDMVDAMLDRFDDFVALRDTGSTWLS